MPENEAALVVTAELKRLTYFWSGTSGAWQFATRDHDALEPVAIGPSSTQGFPWSRRNGVAAWKSTGMVLLKRSIHGSVRLFLDILAMEGDGPRLLTKDPVEVPVELAGVGL